VKREIKTTLALDGEKAFNSAMQQAAREMRVLSSESRATTSAFGENAGSIEGLTSKNTVLSKQIDQQKEIVAALARALDESAAAYGEADQKTDAYRIKLNNATAALNGMQNELSSNETAIESMQAEMNPSKLQGFAGALKAMGQIAGGVVTAGLQAAKIAVVAIGTAVAAAAVGVYKITTAAGDWADELLTLSQNTGVSAKTLQEWTYAARFVDVEVESMAKGLSKIVKATGAAAKAGQGYIQVADGLTVSIRDANGQLRDSEQVFYDAIDAIGKLTNETEKEIAAQELFGKSYQDMMPFINAGSDALNRYAAEAAAAGLVLSDSMIAKLGEFDDVMEKTDAQLDGLGRQFAVIFVPAMQAAAKGFSAFMSKIATELEDGLQPRDIKVIGEYLATNLVEGLKSISKYVPDVVKTISSMLTEVINVIVAVMPELLPALLEGATSLLTGLIEAILENVQPIADMVVQLVTVFVEFLAENVPLVIEAGLGLFTALVNSIPLAIPAIVAAIPQIITGIITAILAAIPQLINAGVQLLIALVNNLPLIITTITAAIPQIIDGITTALTQSIPQIVNAGVQLFVALVKNMPAIIGGIVKAIPQIMAAILSGFGSFVGAMADAGLNLIKGLWEGIKSAADWVWNKIKEFCSGILTKLKNFFGIKSPSTVFAGVGKNMALGLGIGFANEMNAVANDMQDAIPTSFDDPTGSGQPKRSGAGGFVLNQVNNFTNYTTRDGAAAVRDLNRQLGYNY
jgi:phage-related protein